MALDRLDLAPPAASARKGAAMRWRLQRALGSSGHATARNGPMRQTGAFERGASRDVVYEAGCGVARREPVGRAEGNAA